MANTLPSQETTNNDLRRWLLQAKNFGVYAGGLQAIHEASPTLQQKIPQEINEYQQKMDSLKKTLDNPEEIEKIREYYANYYKQQFEKLKQLLGKQYSDIIDEVMKLALEKGIIQSNGQIYLTKDAIKKLEKDLRILEMAIAKLKRTYTPNNYLLYKSALMQRGGRLRDIRKFYESLKNAEKRVEELRTNLKSIQDTLMKGKPFDEFLKKLREQYEKKLRQLEAEYRHAVNEAASRKLDLMRARIEEYKQKIQELKETEKNLQEYEKEWKELKKQGMTNAMDVAFKTALAMLSDEINTGAVYTSNPNNPSNVSVEAALSSAISYLETKKKIRGLNREEEAILDAYKKLEESLQPLLEKGASYEEIARALHGEIQKEVVNELASKYGKNVAEKVYQIAKDTALESYTLTGGMREVSDKARKGEVIFQPSNLTGLAFALTNTIIKAEKTLEEASRNSQTSSTHRTTHRTSRPYHPTTYHYHPHHHVYTITPSHTSSSGSSHTSGESSSHTSSTLGSTTHTSNSTSTATTYSPPQYGTPSAPKTAQPDEFHHYGPSGGYSTMKPSGPTIEDITNTSPAETMRQIFNSHSSSSSSSWSSGTSTLTTHYASSSSSSSSSSSGGNGIVSQVVHTVESGVGTAVHTVESMASGVVNAIRNFFSWL